MKLTILLLITYLSLAYCDSTYIVGDQGQSCNEACYAQGMNCNPVIVTNDSAQIFQDLGIKCTPDNRTWFAEDQPSYSSDPHDVNYGRCLGFKNVPTATQCSGSYPFVRRICRCDPPAKTPSTFGTSISNGTITTQEQWVFVHFVTDGDVGVIDHLWFTYATAVDKGVIIRLYIDGETTASIEFTPSLACGVGYYDPQAPWGIEWFGKGAADGGWFWNFRVPFQKSVAVTVQHQFANYSGFYMIVRGATNIPISVGGKTLPSNARLVQNVINATYQPFDFVPLVNITSGPGVLWMVTLQAGSGNLYFLEGCVHAYFDGDNQFPGVTLATGTEDYFDSASYFNAGQFHLPVSGFTHFSQNSTTGSVTWSAYRFHDQDPLFFDNGFQLMWRIGDFFDHARMKCMVLTGDIVVEPTASDIVAYGWAYTWPSQ